MDKHYLYALDDYNNRTFLDRSFRLFRLIERAKLEIKNHKCFEIQIFKDYTPVSVLVGTVKDNGYIDWVKQPI